MDKHIPGHAVDKMSYNTIGFLEDKNLARFERDQREWGLVEERTALLYMSLLAKYLADASDTFTVPGTDREEYMNLSYAPLSAESSKACLSVHLASCLPIPREDVSLPEILDFRDRRENELNHFRSYIDDLEQKLSAAENGRELKRMLQQSKETIEREVNDLVNQLEDARLATKLASLKTLFTVGNPALAGWLAEAMGYGEKVPLDLGLTGLVAGGFLSVSQYWISQRNERRSTLRGSSYAYLYYGRAESIL